MAEPLQREPPLSTILAGNGRWLNTNRGSPDSNTCSIDAYQRMMMVVVATVMVVVFLTSSSSVSLSAAGSTASFLSSLPPSHSLFCLLSRHVQLALQLSQVFTFPRLFHPSRASSLLAPFSSLLSSGSVAFFPSPSFAARFVSRTIRRKNGAAGGKFSRRTVLT